MRLVFVTQEVDPREPRARRDGAKVAALAARVDEVVVLADRGIDGGSASELPSSHRFASRTKPGRGVRFEAALARELARSPRPAAVVAHMCPIYAASAAPLARPLGVPRPALVHALARLRLLQVAERVSTDVITVEPSTFPLPSRKVVAIGHGIDLAAFPCVERTPDGHDRPAHARPHLAREGARDRHPRRRVCRRQHG